jgi:hypothetical protein
LYIYSGGVGCVVSCISDQQSPPPRHLHPSIYWKLFLVPHGYRHARGAIHRRLVNKKDKWPNLKTQFLRKQAQNWVYKFGHRFLLSAHYSHATLFFFQNSGNTFYIFHYYVQTSSLLFTTLIRRKKE